MTPIRLILSSSRQAAPAEGPRRREDARRQPRARLPRRQLGIPGGGVDKWTAGNKRAVAILTPAAKMINDPGYVTIHYSLT